MAKLYRDQTIVQESHMSSVVCLSNLETLTLTVQPQQQPTKKNERKGPELNGQQKINDLPPLDSINRRLCASSAITDPASESDVQLR